MPGTDNSRSDLGNLPILLTILIGRGRERQEVGALLQSSPLVTLTGPAGIGKTRLASEVACDLAASYPDGSWLVSIAPLRDPDLVAGSVAAALSLPLRGDDHANDLVDHLRSRRLLLVLDGCDELIEACGKLAGRLVTSCPDLRILASSRQSLDATGERAWQVCPLSLHDDRGSGDFPWLAPGDAQRLFCDRAAAADPGFVPGADEMSAVTEVCRQLGGVPLAIELAAATVASLSVSEVASQLDQGLSMLSGEPALPVGHDERLQELIAWAHTQLSAPQQAVLRRLAVFPGHIGLAAAEEVCCDGVVGREEVFEILSGLVASSFVVAELVGPHGRYRLPESVQRVAQQHLVEADEEAAAKERLTAWCIELAHAAEPHLSGSNQQEWLARLDLEKHSLRAALEWTISCRRVEAATGLASSLATFWRTRGYLSEGCAWVEHVLGLPDIDESRRAKLLFVAAVLTAAQGRFSAALSRAEDAVALAGDPGHLRPVIRAVGLVATIIATSANTGDDRRATAGVQADLARCQKLATEALSRAESAGEEDATMAALHGLATIAWLGGDQERAAELWQRCLALADEAGDDVHAAQCLAGLAALAALQGCHDRAARLFGAAEGVLQTGAMAEAVDPVLSYQAELGATRDALGQKAFVTAKAEGGALSRGEACSYARRGRGIRRRPAAGWEGLTPTELKVVSAVVEGLTNREVAERLFMSPRTVTTHLSRIYTKLNVRSRAKLAREASARQQGAPGASKHGDGQHPENT